MRYLHEADKLQGSPTDVRRIDVSETLEGLTDDERKYIREKASSDAIHLLKSYPPSHPPSLPSSSHPSPEHSLRCEPSSLMASRESSALLNAASRDLPDTLPTPPPQKHHESASPTTRMKNMWEINRFSSTSSCRDSLYEKLEEDGKVRDESFTTMHLMPDYQEKSDHSKSPCTLSLASGFEAQDTVGGHAAENAPIMKNKTVVNAVEQADLTDSSDSEEDSFVGTQGKPLADIRT